MALGAAPAMIELTVNSTTPTTNIVLRPRASPSRPDATSTNPKLRAYPETIHCSSAALASSPSRIEGSATLTMDTFNKLMKPAARHTVNAFHRSGAGLWLGYVFCVVKSHQSGFVSGPSPWFGPQN